MKSFFDETEHYTEEGLALDVELQQALMPILEKWLKAGYSKRQIQLMVQSSAFEAGLNIIVGF